MIRWCREIGLWAIDRGRESCRHRTRFCELYCYNIPLYHWQKSMVKRDAANEKFWESLTGEGLRELLSRKKHAVERIRLCTRGEAFSTLRDVRRVKDLLEVNHGTLFWIPTRGWRDVEIRRHIEDEILVLPNARVMASVDPSNSVYEVESLQRSGWSMVRIGAPVGPWYLCPKTYEHKTGACGYRWKCWKGCFSADRVDVHLQLHWGGGTPGYKDWQTKRFAGMELAER